jgi:CheY-like chemotaxis protein
MHHPARILIVDDNETNRDILKTRLAVHGYDLLEAGDGEQALAALSDFTDMGGLAITIAGEPFGHRLYHFRPNVRTLCSGVHVATVRSLADDAQPLSVLKWRAPLTAPPARQK